MNIRGTESKLVFKRALRSCVLATKGPKLSHNVEHIMQSHDDLRYPGVRINVCLLTSDCQQCDLQRPASFLVAPPTAATSEPSGLKEKCFLSFTIFNI